MPTTTKGLRYPAATDRVMDGATAMQNLASDVDAKLPALTTGAAPTFLTGWVLGSEGYSLQRVPLATGAVLVTVQIHATRASGASTVTAGSTGNITDIDICTLPTGYRPAKSWGFAWQAVGTSVASGKIDVSGTITWQEFSTGGTFPAGENMRIAATYLVAA